MTPRQRATGDDDEQFEHGKKLAARFIRAISEAFGDEKIEMRVSGSDIIAAIRREKRYRDRDDPTK